MNAQLWLIYFRLNAVAPRSVPWDLGGDLPAEEARFTIPSLQEFQVGERSDGNRLRTAAAGWARCHGDEDFARMVDLFIAEEQRHAAELGRFLASNGYSVRGRTVCDSIFRLLRHMSGGLEGSLSVLMTAEIIGFVYYEALRKGTSSVLLREICRTFLYDEAAHLLFHTEQLSRMRKSRPRVLAWVVRNLSWGLMGGSCAVVWMRHHHVLQSGGLTFAGFVARCFERLAFVSRVAHNSRHPRLPAAGRRDLSYTELTSRGRL